MVQTEAALPAFRTICFAFALEPVQDNQRMRIAACRARGSRGAGEARRGDALIRGEGGRLREAWVLCGSSLCLCVVQTLQAVVLRCLTPLAPPCTHSSRLP